MRREFAVDIDKKLSHLETVIRKEDIESHEILVAMEDVLTWLVDNNTDENCRNVDNFISTRIGSSQRKHLPHDIQEIISDMGGALHDTHTSPEIAKNFESTPEQLLHRLSRILKE